jgi:hypothetical protein
MVFKQGEQIIETSREARQAERGPTVRNVLVVSTGLVIVAFAIIWLVFSDDEIQKTRHLHGIAKDLGLVCALIAADLSGLSLNQLHPGNLQRVADSAQQGAAPTDQSKPAKSKPGGTRPTTPAPQPARPEPDAEKQGAKAPLPPAPAEKVAPPIEQK